MLCRNIFLGFMFCIFVLSTPASAESTWVFGSPINNNPMVYNSSAPTIQYYPPELGSRTIYTQKRNATTPSFYAIPGRIEPNVQPNPMRDEMEKTHYVYSDLIKYC